MKRTNVKGNTWILEGPQLVGLYQIDEKTCLLFDPGSTKLRPGIEAALQEAGLTPVAILGSHTHIDHMGSHAYFQKTRGTQVVMSLGEAGQIFSPWASSCNTTTSHGPLPGLSRAGHRPLRARPGDPPGGGGRHPLRGHLRHPPHPGPHRGPHLHPRPGQRLYLGDAMMTGRTLHHSKFPYAFCVKDYLDSMRKMRTEPAEKFIVAHFGHYERSSPWWTWRPGSSPSGWWTS